MSVLGDPVSGAVYRWFNDCGDATLRLNYPLTENSIVFDIGGYKGEWAEKIIKLYNPYIYIFEPIPEYYLEIFKKLGANPKVSIYNFGLSDKNEKASISLLSNSSSIYKKGKNCINIRLQDISNFIKKANISRIDLMKINIEGGEYSLLERMINVKIIEICQDIQVQFHNFMPEAERRRNKIRESLAKTHFTTYEYLFVWENWRRNE
jgi:FkbM family methyltransferase